MRVGAWIGLVGVVAGAGLAAAGQWLTNRSASQGRFASLVVSQCSELIALSEDFRNRLWEERNGLRTDAVALWDLASYRVAEAHLQVLAENASIQSAVADLKQTGANLGRTWRIGRTDDDALEEAWRAHRGALDRFIEASREFVKPKVKFLG
jgi:hypothetical protein